MEHALGTEPNNPSSLCADVDGGILLHDFNGEPSLWRLGVDGSIRTSLTPTDPENVAAERLERRMLVSPDGTLWSSDGRVFVQLDESGAVQRVVGNAAEPDRFYEPGAVEISFGRVLAQDERTANVHVFDPTGKRVQLCRATPEDLKIVSSISAIISSSDGSVYVECGGYKNDDYIHFAPSGERIGTRSFPGFQNIFPPSEDHCWGRTHEGLSLAHADGTIENVIPRRPDNRFFWGGSMAFAPNGSMAIYDDDSLICYDAGLAAAGQILALPEEDLSGNFAWSGRWAAIADWSPDVYLVDTQDNSLHHFALPFEIDTTDSWDLGFSPDGSELWAVERRPLMLHRFKLP